MRQAGQVVLEPERANRILNELGWAQHQVISELQQAARNGGFVAAEKRLEDKKSETKAVYRKLALKYHPDHGGDAEDFRHLQALWEHLQKAKVERPRPPPVRFVQIIHSSTGSTVTSTVGGTWTHAGWTGTSTGGGFY